MPGWAVIADYADAKRMQAYHRLMEVNAAAAADIATLRSEYAFWTALPDLPERLIQREETGAEVAVPLAPPPPPRKRRRFDT